MSDFDACSGAEICIAKQDLVIGFDWSGSAREAGVKILKSFVITLLKRSQMTNTGEYL